MMLYNVAFFCRSWRQLFYLNTLDYFCQHLSLIFFLEGGVAYLQALY